MMNYTYGAHVVDWVILAAAYILIMVSVAARVRR